MSDAQRILEEYLEPRPHNNERILEKLVDVLERPDVLVAVGRLARRVVKVLCVQGGNLLAASF
jgi:hypothetical protein